MHSTTTSVGSAHRQVSVSLSRSAARTGATLIELLTVVAIMGVLAGTLLPAVQASRESARRIQCSNHLKQVALASLAYESSFRELPIGSHNSYWKTWMVQLMPFLDQQAFYDNYDHRLYIAESRFDRGRNAVLTAEVFDVFACPNQQPVRTTFGQGASAHSYAACTGNGAYVSTAAGWNTNPPVSMTPIGTYSVADLQTLSSGMLSGASISGTFTSTAGPVSLTGATLQPGGTIKTGGSVTLSIQAIVTGSAAGTGGTGVPPLLPLLLPFFLVTGSEGGPTSPVTLHQFGNRFSAFKAFQGGAYQMSGGNGDLTPAEDQTLLREAIAIRVAEITDGLSKTLAFSEVLRAETEAGSQGTDYRGLGWWGPSSLFSTLAPPNSQLPDVMPRTGDCASDDLTPCICPHTSANPVRLLARSRHPGGVVAATCDGAVDFYPNEIDATVWENLGTTQGDLPQ